MRSTSNEFGVFLCLTHDALKCTDERIYRLPCLCFGRLNHQRAANYQREVDGGRMKAVVNEALSHIQSLDPRLLLKQSICEDCFMQRLRFKSQGKKLSY